MMEQSALRILSVADGMSWNRELLALPGYHALQTWQWGLVKSRFGWQMHPLRFLDGEKAVGQALLLTRNLPGLPWRLAYTPRGPLFPYEDADLTAALLSALQREARRRRALFLKIDPDIDPNSVAGRALRERLSASGWRFSPQQIQFRNTALLDLSADEGTLLAGMKQKSRYNVRLAARKGVRVEIGTEADFPAFYSLYQETAARDRFLIRPYAYYETAWRTFRRAGMGVLLLAFVPGEENAVAGLFLFLFGRKAWYMYGASSSRGRKLMPNYLLQWEAMRWAKAHGVVTYDLWGAPEQLTESDPMWGVYRFKIGLGATFREGLGAWDYPFHRSAYRLYLDALPRLLSFWRRVTGNAGRS